MVKSDLLVAIIEDKEEKECVVPSTWVKGVLPILAEC